MAKKRSAGYSERKAAKLKRRYLERKALGLCVTCGSQALPSRVWCDDCRIKTLQAIRRTRRRDGKCRRCGSDLKDWRRLTCLECLESMKAKRQALVALGICSRCKNGPRTIGTKCQPCWAESRELQKLARLRGRKAQHQNHHAKRKLAMQKYGGACSCCGESSYQFLAFDHINGGGNKHRKELGDSKAIVRWIIKNNYPDSIRLLCHNCNHATAYGFVCPHQIVALD